MELSKDALQTGPYHISLVSSDESIDSCYYPKGKLVWKECLLVFHTKEVSRHPVCGQGIVTVLEKLELLKKALKKPLDKNKLERKHTIRWDVLSNFEIVEIISDIGPAETNQLKAINVKTVRVYVQPSMRQVHNSGPSSVLEYRLSTAQSSRDLMSARTRLKRCRRRFLSMCWRCRSNVSCRLMEILLLQEFHASFIY
ncbi:hypothetical protein JG688_00013726 [Phytophthora aleatoria]|uniref:Uncharacterized protein n=1 Tax=Phytophthora aleatoria TaxID=2496075 RepID=A0A8J5MEA2_9STRA|nr:hypothetical protein JG688_00013726 [Phytophthora aleatoria]